MAQHKTSVIRFLNELNSKEVKETFDFLSTIIENLETKNDPDAMEMQIVDSAYQAIEKMSMLESNLKEYVRNANATSLPGNKLFDLYK